jgi:hypothetical protein
MKNLDAFKAHGDIIWNIANLFAVRQNTRIPLMEL